MTLNERLKYLRKNILNLTQKAFAEKINVSTSNIGSIEIGRIKVTNRVINDICETFSINKNWLLNGTEPIFSEDTDPFVTQLIDIYKNLNDDNRKYLKGYVYRLLEEQKTN